MGIFPRFGGWITQNIQQPLKVSSYPPIKGPFEVYYIGSWIDEIMIMFAVVGVDQETWE